MRGFIFRSAVIALAAAFYAPTAFSIALGNFNNFNGGTEEGWASSVFGAVNPNPPNNIPNGGPGGVGDGFLSLISIFNPGPGMAPGSRLTAFNQTPTWTGDYTAAGVTKITMDVRNFGQTAVELRLAFLDLDATFTFADNFAVSTVGIPVAAGAGWATIAFNIAASDLTALVGTAAGALNADSLRIFHNTVPAFPAVGFGGLGIPSLTAVIGVDNPTAIPVPPAIALLASGLIGLCARRRIG